MILFSSVKKPKLLKELEADPQEPPLPPLPGTDKPPIEPPVTDGPPTEPPAPPTPKPTQPGKYKYGTCKDHPSRLATP